MLHKNALVGDRHAVHDWEVADLDALAALVPLSTEVGKIAKVASPLGFYILANHTGPVWHKLANAGDIVTEHGALIGLADDDHEQYALSIGTVDRAVFDIDGIADTQIPIWDTASSTFIPGAATSGTRTQLTANTTYYVATTGNDTTGDGSVGAPWLTVQKAIDWIAANVDGAGYVVTVQLADGTYNITERMATKICAGITRLVIQGNVADNTAVKIVNTNNTGIMGHNVLSHTLEMIHLELTSVGGVIIFADAGAFFRFGNIAFTACTGGTHVYAQQGGYIQCIANCSISGGSNSFLNALYGGRISINSRTFTLTGTPAFSVFCFFARLGVIAAESVTFSGSATGQRYLGSINAICFTNGGGANYFPGNSAGSVATGAQYA